MRTISVGQLRQNPTAMLRSVSAGEVYVVTNHGQPVADVVPHRSERRRTAGEVAEFFATWIPSPGWLEDIESLDLIDEFRDPWEGTVGKDEAEE